MDHITRCPNCSTTFRVTEAQLAAFQGKVRCGKCAFVFNARQSLIEPPPAPAAPPPEMPAQAAETVEPAPSESLPFETAPQSHATVEDKPATADDFTVEDQEPPTEVPPETPAEAEAGAQTEVKEEGAEAAREESDPTALMQTEEPPPPPTGAAPENAEAGGYRPIVLPEDEALFAPLPQPKHARIWTFAALLAGFAFLLQLAFAYRLNLIAEFPALQPRLAGLCQTIGCEMPLPRKAEQLRLEWSELTFVPDHPSLVQLSATLRNLAPYDQALPLLELTLTDTRERVVARRILRPDEYLTASEKSRTSLPRGDELHAFLQLDLGELKSTGYSLYWFYE